MTDDTSKHLILLAEDDQALRELYAMALIKAGFEIVMAENGEQAATIALERHPDLVLLDIDMPRMNGHEVAQKIRTDSWGKTARIIFLTNHSDPSNVAHAVMQKPEEYIVKATRLSLKLLTRCVRLCTDTLELCRNTGFKNRKPNLFFF